MNPKAYFKNRFPLLNKNDHHHRNPIIEVQSENIDGGAHKLSRIMYYSV